MAKVFWFRKDLRLQDNPALNLCAKAAKKEDSQVIPLYFLNSKSFEDLSGIRQHSLIASLKALDQSMNNSLRVLTYQKANEISLSLSSLKVSEVFATESFDPEGIREQQMVGKELAKAGISLNLSNSNYAVTPGSVRKPVDQTPYRVYTPFYRAWLLEGWEKPHVLESGFSWLKAKIGESFPMPTKDTPYKVRAGEFYAGETFERFKKSRLRKYDQDRNRADLSGTSKLSFALAHGEIHPRTLLSKLGSADAHIVFQKEIAWREFYADVLFHNPATLNDYYDKRFAKMRYDEGAEAKRKLTAWKQGRTGYPMVDAGMRQLLSEGWMHNRVRMIVASFLVKDLHIEWQHGASWFEENLADYDPASNSHGWQWTAGCGTDASPYYRIFNPILQGYKFDPEGNYVRKHIPELCHIDGAEVHEPWKLIDGLAKGYPEPIVDHNQERDEALRRLEEIKEK